METKQLYEQVGNEYKPINPSVSLNELVDKESDLTFGEILSKYNHLKVNWKGDASSTRNEVPIKYRRNGLYITYNNGTDLVTEYYVGSNNSITTETWTADSNWKTPITEEWINANINKLKPARESVGYEQLTPALRQLVNKNTNVTNCPDDEDLTSQYNLLKFKDREYDADNFSGKGYVILRKNVKKVNKVTKNILEQSMINKENTIYEIRYDFDLNGETINIPENCVLKFEGGSLSNGSLVGNPLNYEFSLSNFRYDLVNLDKLIRNFCTEKLIINFDKDIYINDDIYIHRKNIQLSGNNHSITGNFKLYIDNNNDDISNIVIDGFVFNITNNINHTILIGKITNKDEKLNHIYNFEIKNCEFNTSFYSVNTLVNFDEEVNKIAFRICGVLENVYIYNNKFVNKDSINGVAIMISMPYTNYNQSTTKYNIVIENNFINNYAYSINNYSTGAVDSNFLFNNNNISNCLYTRFYHINNQHISNNVFRESNNIEFWGKAIVTNNLFIRCGKKIYDYSDERAKFNIAIIFDSMNGVFSSNHISETEETVFMFDNVASSGQISNNIFLENNCIFNNGIHITGLIFSNNYVRTTKKESSIINMQNDINMIRFVIVGNYFVGYCNKIINIAVDSCLECNISNNIFSNEQHWVTDKNENTIAIYIVAKNLANMMIAENTFNTPRGIYVNNNKTVIKNNIFNCDKYNIESLNYKYYDNNIYFNKKNIAGKYIKFSDNSYSYVGEDSYNKINTGLAGNVLPVSYKNKFLKTIYTPQLSIIDITNITTGDIKLKLNDEIIQEITIYDNIDVNTLYNRIIEYNNNTNIRIELKNNKLYFYNLNGNQDFNISFEGTINYTINNVKASTCLELDCNGLSKVNNSILNNSSEISTISDEVLKCHNYYLQTGLQVWLKDKKRFAYFSNYDNKSIYVLSDGFDANYARIGTTTERPNPKSSDGGFEYYDSTLKKKILWNGSAWVNVDGSSLSN